MIPCFFPDVVPLQNNTYCVKPFKTSVLVLFCQRDRDTSPKEEKKMLRSYFMCDMQNEKCDVVKLGTTIEPKIMAYLQSWQSV